MEALGQPSVVELRRPTQPKCFLTFFFFFDEMYGGPLVMEAHGQLSSLPSPKPGLIIRSEVKILEDKTHFSLLSSLLQIASYTC